MNQIKVGVVVGRFQVPDLHLGHSELLKSVLAENDELIVVLGISPLPPNRSDPLSWDYRRDMIVRELELYKNLVAVASLKDHPSDEVWSKNLDSTVGSLVREGSKVTLYGSRDSFIPHYSGKFATKIVTSHDGAPSGTTVRRNIANNKDQHRNPDFGYGHGVIWATQQQFPTVYSTVDVAAFNNQGQVLMIRKPGMTTWGFVGGFADPTSESDEQDAIREVLEETNLVVSGLTYVGNTNINDWRYRKENRIRTRFYVGAIHDVTGLNAQDDVEEARFFDLEDLPDIIQECHKPLLTMLLEHLNV